MKALIQIPHPFFLKKIGGIPLISRMIRVLQQAGIFDIYIMSNILELTEGNIHIIRKKEEIASKIGDSYLHIDIPCVFDKNFISSLLSKRTENIILFSKIKENQYNGLFYPIVKEKDEKIAEKLLLQSLRKPHDTFISRNLNRPISLFVTSFLMHTPISPNWITLFVFLIGVAASLVMMIPQTPNYWHGLLGGFLFHLASVLDGCDGEIARLKFQSSRLGTWLDNISDELTNFLFVGAVGVYCSTLYQNTLYFELSLIMMLVFLVTKILQYIMIIKKLQKEDIAQFDFGLDKQTKGIKKIFNFLFQIGTHIARKDFLALGMFVAGIFGIFPVGAFIIYFFVAGLFISVIINFIKKISISYKIEKYKK